LGTTQQYQHDETESTLKKAIRYGAKFQENNVVTGLFGESSDVQIEEPVTCGRKRWK
jgi:hypothetical protein